MIVIGIIGIFGGVVVSGKYVYLKQYNELEVLAANRIYNKVAKQEATGSKNFVPIKDEEVMAFKKVKLNTDKIRMFNLYGDNIVDMMPYIINYFQRHIVYMDYVLGLNGRDIIRELGYSEETITEDIKRFINNELDFESDGKYKYSDKTSDCCVSYCSTFSVIQAFGFNVYTRFNGDNTEENASTKGRVNLLRVIAFMAPVYLIKHPSKLISLILDYNYYSMIRGLERGNTDEFVDIDITYIDKTYEFINSYVQLWSINILKSISNSKDRVIMGLTSKQLDELESRYRETIEKTYKRGSYLKKLMHGKITVVEYIDNRMLAYKTRRSDYTCEQLILFSKDINNKIHIEKLLKYLNSQYITDIVERASYRISNLYYLISLCGTLNSKMLSEIGSGNALNEFKDKLKKANSEIESLNDSLSKERIKTSNFREKSKGLENELAKIKNTYVPKEQTSKYVEEIKSKSEEIKRLTNELNEAHKSLESKTKDYSEIAKQNKKLKNTLDNYIKTFGELEDSSEEETDEFNTKLNGSSDISYESKIEYLKLFKILLCGGNDSVYNVLVDKTGLDLLFVNKENSVSANAKFDICVILTTMSSHSVIEKVSNRAVSSGAEIIYFEGSNHNKLINTLYDRMYKIYGEI